MYFDIINHSIFIVFYSYSLEVHVEIRYEINHQGSNYFFGAAMHGCIRSIWLALLIRLIANNISKRRIQTYLTINALMDVCVYEFLIVIRIVVEHSIDKRHITHVFLLSSIIVCLLFVVSEFTACRNDAMLRSITTIAM